MPDSALEEAWDKALRETEMDGWPPLQVLEAVKQETLTKAVRQRGRVADLYTGLEGIIRRADPPAGSVLAGKMHGLKNQASFHAS